MTSLLIAGVVCLVASAVVLCARGLIAMAMRRYPRVKAGVHVGRSGFYIEADDGRE